MTSVVTRGAVRPRAVLALLACASSLQIGCSTVLYYEQAIGGHLRLMAARRDIPELIAAERTDRQLRDKLALVLEVRDFASRELALPENRSYRSYVDVKGAYVVWNVVATPELSLSPETWCFPVVGCVAYRGYYARSKAMAFAERLEARGLDVAVAGASAYSTLGWFDDPVLSTMIAQPEHHLIAVIFHELAHQQVYIEDDSAFNEAFAVALEREGVRRWYASRGDGEALERYERSLARDAAFVEMVLETRRSLEGLYASDVPVERMREEKRRTLEALRERYRRDEARLGAGYASWFRALNNAKLALIATYEERVPAFEALLDQVGGDLAAFYRAVEALGALPESEREAQLAALAGELAL